MMIEILIISLIILVLVNVLVIKIYNYVNDENRNFFWKNSLNKLSGLNQNNDFDELKRKTRIVIIDEEECFPLNSFREISSYLIDKWDNVKEFDKLKSGFYDIIIIVNSIKHSSIDNDFILIEKLKLSNPSQLIVYYSQNIFDLNNSRFWELTDENIEMPCSHIEIKKCIDKLIKTKFTPTRYVISLQEILRKNKVSEDDILKIETSISKSIKKNDIPNWGNLVKNLDSKTELANQVISFGKTIIKTAK